jgi:hypothetical protein
MVGAWCLVPHCLKLQSPRMSVLRPSCEKEKGRSYDIYRSPAEGAPKIQEHPCAHFWKRRRPLGDDLLSFSLQSSLLRSRQRDLAACCTKMASAPSCTCCWVHPSRLPQLCMLSCASQDPAKASPSVSHCLLSPTLALSGADLESPGLGGSQG